MSRSHLVGPTRTGVGLAKGLGLWIGLTLLLTPVSALPSQVVRMEQRVEIDLLVPPIQRLEVNHSIMTTPVLQPRDFDRGHFLFSDPLWVTISSNSPWELAVRRPPGGSLPSPWDTLELLDGSRALSAVRAWQTLARGEETKEMSLPFQVRVPLSWVTTAPGSYEPRLEYRLGPDRIYP